MKPIKNIDDPRYVKAMSHPLRVRILAMLDERKASPNQLASWLGASLGTVAYHVRTLEQLGLIELVDETRVRGAVEHHYRARERPNVTAEGWAQAPPIAKQAAVGSSLDVIADYARASAAAGGFDRADAHMTRRSLQLDDDAFAELAAATRRWLDEAEAIGAAAAERMARSAANDGGAAAIDAGLVVMLCEGRPADDGPPGGNSHGDGRVTRSRAAAVRD